MPAAAPAAPGPTGRRGLPLRLGALAVATVPAALFLADYLGQPARRDPRGLVVLGVLLVPFVYMVLSVARHAVGGRAANGWWRLPVGAVAFVLGFVLLPHGAVEPLAKSRERAVARRTLRPLLDALEAERGRTGQPPTARLAELASQHLGVPDRGNLMLPWTFSCLFAGDKVAFEVAARPMDRDNDAYWLLVSDGTWAHWETNGPFDETSRPEALRDMPWTRSATSCRCVLPMPPRLPWMCGPPCGPPIEEQEAQLTGRPLPSPSPVASPSPAAVPSPSPAP